MGERKKDMKRKMGAPIGALASQDKKKNHENDKVKKYKRWVLFLPLNVALKHHSLALQNLNTSYLAWHSTTRVFH